LAERPGPGRRGGFGAAAMTTGVALVGVALERTPPVPGGSLRT
jgi:hypothetical protein